MADVKPKGVVLPLGEISALTRDERISKLRDFSMSLGIADTKLLRADQIALEDRFRSLCEKLRCPSYDTSVNCPPHSMTPSRFRDVIEGFTHVLAFKFDMPAEALQVTELREASRLLHETTAFIEHAAKSLGFDRAQGYSSGGCKQTFCYEHADCSALQDGGLCRHSDMARPSLSGMGVNWYELSKSLGWEMQKGEDGTANAMTGTVMMAGLVFLD